MRLKILNDKRPITSILLRSGVCWSTEKDDTTREWSDFAEKIEAYGEPGQLAEVPWFAIWRNSVVIARVNAEDCEDVCYIGDQDGESDLAAGDIEKTE